MDVSIDRLPGFGQEGASVRESTQRELTPEEKQRQILEAQVADLEEQREKLRGTFNQQAVDGIIKMIITFNCQEQDLVTLLKDY